MSKNRSNYLLNIGLMLALLLAYAVACAPTSQDPYSKVEQATQMLESAVTPPSIPTSVTTFAEPEPIPTRTPEVLIAEPTNTSLNTATGLPLNPEVFPIGDFIVEGPVKSLFIIPKDEPAFLVQIENRAYLIVSQHLDNILMEDGTTLAPLDFKTGIIVRATVSQTGEVDYFGYPILASDDLVVLAKSE